MHPIRRARTGCGTNGNGLCAAGIQNIEPDQYFKENVIVALKDRCFAVSFTPANQRDYCMYPSRGALT
jgi:hypothetical protein